MIQELMLKNLHLDGINPLICGCENCVSGHFYGPDRRNYYLLHFVSFGKGMLKNSRGNHLVATGQIFVIRPGELTIYTADDKEPWTYYWIGFESSLQLEEILKQDVISLALAETIFESMLNSLPQQGQELYVCGKIYELLSMICAKQKPKFGIKEQYVHKAVNYIESNYQRDFDVTSLATALNLDRSYFSRLFKEIVGTTPQEYIVKYRLSKAADLMTTYGVSPSDAANLVGYHDLVNFSRMFKRKFGLSPRAFRSKYVEEDKNGD